MNILSKNILTVLFLTVLMFAGSITQAQKDSTETKTSLETLRKLDEWKSRLNTSLAAENSVLKQLYVIESEQRRQENELAKIRRALAAIRARAADAEEKIDLLRTDKKRRTEIQKATLRRLYKLGQGGLWQILFESRDIHSFLMRYKIIRTLLERDKQIITGFQRQVRKLAAIRSDISSDIMTLAKLKDEGEKRQELVWFEREKRITLLEKIQRNKVLAMRATRELEQQNARLTDTIRSFSEPTRAPTVSPDSLVLDFANKKGKLKLPVIGGIVGHFGLQTSRQFGTVTKNHGIDIVASAGSPARVIADGIVRYVGEFLGYGRVVIVDHGGRYHSLYAHLDRFLIAKDDAVKEGTQIGTVGKSGALTECGLHFEIRHKGVALNPIDWFSLSTAKEEK